MQKSKLVNFIDKYNLKETVESVVISVSDNTLTTKFIDEIGALRGNVTYNNFTNNDVKFGVFDTKILKKFISIMDSEIQIDIKSSEKGVDSLIFNDNNKLIKFIPCDLEIVPKVPPFKAELPTNFSIVYSEITDSFIDDFVKSEAVLSDVDVFDIMFNPSIRKYEIVFGHSDTSDTNTIKFPLNVDINEDEIFKRVRFKSSYVREILLANKDMIIKTMKVFKGGLMIFEFKSDEFECNYYLQSMEG